MTIVTTADYTGYHVTADTPGIVRPRPTRDEKRNAREMYRFEMARMRAYGMIPNSDIAYALDSIRDIESRLAFRNSWGARHGRDFGFDLNGIDRGEIRKTARFLNAVCDAVEQDDRHEIDWLFSVDYIIHAGITI